MKTLCNDDKCKHLPTLAYSAGWVCAFIALGLTGGVVRASPMALNVPGLGSAARFAILSAAPNGLGAVTTTRSTIIGDVGTSGLIASVVRTEGTITGAIIAPVSPEVLADVNRAHVAFALLPRDQTLTGTLAGITLPPGVYSFDAAAALTGLVTLVGPPNGIWVFKIGENLTTTGLARVVLAGGARASNVYWAVTGAATLTDSIIVGTIVAGSDITITRGTFVGKALSMGKVTLTDTSATKSSAQARQSRASQPRNMQTRGPVLTAHGKTAKASTGQRSPQR
jgi:hypothetical protein